MQDNRALEKFKWVIILVFGIIIVLLISQNLHLKSKPPIQKTIIQKSPSVVFEENIKDLFIYKKFPIDLDVERFYFQTEYPMTFVRFKLVMLFDFTVCGHCMHEQLKILNQYKQMLEDKNIRLLGIIGTVSKGEETDIITLKNSGEIFFPCKIIPVKQLYDTFDLVKERFLDTPFYVFTTHENFILDVIKPAYLDTTELMTFMDRITRMDII